MVHAMFMAGVIRAKYRLFGPETAKSAAISHTPIFMAYRGTRP